MTECKDQRWLFQELGNRKVEVDFGGWLPLQRWWRADITRA